MLLMIMMMPLRRLFLFNFPCRCHLQVGSWFNDLGFYVNALLQITSSSSQTPERCVKDREKIKYGSKHLPKDCPLLLCANYMRVVAKSRTLHRKAEFLYQWCLAFYRLLVLELVDFLPMSLPKVPRSSTQRLS